MNWYSLIYGLHVHSNLCIPGAVATAIAPNRPADVQVIWGAFPDSIAELLAAAREPYYTSPWLDERGNSHLQVDKLASGTYFHLQYSEGVQFICDCAGTQVWGNWTDELTLDYAALYFLGPILGFLLRLRGTTCLHASCIAVGDCALALVGVSGAGKSTTAAAFAARGYQVLSDDVSPLIEKEGIFHIIPGYPRLRLWPESVEVLCGDREAQPKLAPNYDKRYLALNPDNFSLHPLPLKALYFLDWSSEVTGNPSLIACPPTEGFVKLVANTYRNELLDKAMRQQEFQTLSHLASQIPLRRLVSYRDLRKLSLLCDLILEDFQAVTRI